MTARSARPRLIGLILAVTLTSGCDWIISILEPPRRGPEFVLVVDSEFHGWACVDTGVEGASELPREGEAFLVRVSSMGILRTSTRPSELLSFFPRSIFVEAHGERSALPPGVELRRSTGDTDSNSPIARHCVFLGTEEAAETAGDPPELQRSGSGSAETRPLTEPTPK